MSLATSDPLHEQLVLGSVQAWGEASGHQLGPHSTQMTSPSENLVPKVASRVLA